MRRDALVQGFEELARKSLLFVDYFRDFSAIGHTQFFVYEPCAE